MLIAFRAVRFGVALAALLLVNSFPVLAEQGAPTAVADAAPPPRFEIIQYDVSGNTILKQSDINQALVPFTGKNKDFADVQRALEALQGMYQKLGFGSVQVILPEQELEKGVVKFVIIESKIATVKVEGNQHFDEANIRRSMPALRVGEPPNSREISSNIRLANESPSKQTTVVLKGAETEGEIDATLKVTDEKPWRAVLSLDNTGTPDTGRFRMGAAYQYSNLFNLDHSLAVQYQTSPGHLSDVQLFGALYHIPIYSLGDSLDLTMALSNVASGTVQLGGSQGLAVSGEGTIYQARYNQNFDKRGDYEQKLVYGFDYRMYRPSICPTGTNAACTDSDAFMKPLSLTYSGLWKPVGQQLSVFAGAESNLPGGRNGSDDYYQKNFSLDADFTILHYGADYSKALPGDWQAHFAFDAQYASMKLINYVQYGLGGVNSVRGFHERELVGDKGVRGSIEVYTPDYGAHFGEKVNLRALAFFDFGRVMYNSPVGSAEDPQGIGSVGLGLRVGLNKALSVRADLASVVDGVGKQLTYSGKTVTGDIFTSVGIGYLF